MEVKKMDRQLLNELELLTKKIEANTAKVIDYQRYETILTRGGLTRERIYSYLKRAGFKTWTEFYKARNNKITSKNIEAGIIGGLIGLGVGLLIASLLED